MANKVIQMSLSETEYFHLQKKAEREGVPVALYIKNMVLGDTDFKKYFQELLARVSRIQSNTEFNIKMVFATDWAGIEKGVRLALGRAFYNYINANKLSNVKAKNGKDSAHVQWYIKL